jgi:hypothetical protein
MAYKEYGKYDPLVLEVFETLRDTLMEKFPGGAGTYEKSPEATVYPGIKIGDWLYGYDDGLFRRLVVYVDPDQTCMSLNVDDAPCHRNDRPDWAEGDWLHQTPEAALRSLDEDLAFYQSMLDQLTQAQQALAAGTPADQAGDILWERGRRGRLAADPEPAGGD